MEDDWAVKLRITKPPIKDTEEMKEQKRPQQAMEMVHHTPISRDQVEETTAEVEETTAEVEETLTAADGFGEELDELPPDSFAFINTAEDPFVSVAVQGRAVCFRVSQELYKQSFCAEPKTEIKIGVQFAKKPIPDAAILFIAGSKSMDKKQYTPQIKDSHVSIRCTDPPLQYNDRKLRSKRMKYKIIKYDGRRVLWVDLPE